MNKLKLILVIFLLSIQAFHASGQTTSPLSLVEATSGCGDVSNCSIHKICFDVMISPDTTGIISAYNIWIQYPLGGSLSYISDKSCLTADGVDNNLNSQGYFRFAGVQGTTTVTENVSVRLHNICFTYTTLDAIDNQTIFVGGTVFGTLNSTLTYSMPILNEPKMPAYPFRLDSSSISCILLPVNWLDFQAHGHNSITALNWTTSEEFNNHGFEVMRSPDGQVYEKIGWVAAKDQPTAVNAYQFIDLDPKRGTNYYRLKQFDLDGQFGFSPVRWVIFMQDYFKVVVTPNPAREFITMEIYTQEPFSTVNVLDGTGRVVLTTKVIGADITTRLRVDQLSHGTYTLVIESGAQRFTERIAVISW